MHSNSVAAIVIRAVMTSQSRHILVTYNNWIKNSLCLPNISLDAAGVERAYKLSEAENQPGKVLRNGSEIPYTAYSQVASIIVRSKQISREPCKLCSRSKIGLTLVSSKLSIKKQSSDWIHTYLKKNLLLFVEDMQALIFCLLVEKE